MNKTISLLIFFSLLSCFRKNNIEVNFADANEKVVILSAMNNRQYITRILFPKRIKITNVSNSTISFVKLTYLYNQNMPIEKDYGIGLFEQKNNKLYTISTTGKKKIDSKKWLEYSLYTKHYIDTSALNQKKFKEFTNKMFSENKDTLHIGTVSEFKQKHKDLFEKLTKNDSISIQLLDDGKLGKLISVPVSW
ncbi:hypothetical protein [Tenacibaculum sp. 190130A14a]|uniref:Lipoprotein n=1 Tax=Tenacibaculum polynesiense TaxID=3137857 RepID=A0ABP1F3D6_9FLAO